MRRRQAFKYELMPNGEQARDMHRIAGSCRFVYNQALALQKTHYSAGGRYIGYVAMANRLPEWKRQWAWLKDSPSQALQHALKNLEQAYKNFFEKRAAFPRFKKRGMGDGFRYPQGFKIDEAHDRLFLPKLGWMRYRNSRKIVGEAKNITLSLSGGKWFASIQTEREVDKAIPSATSAVGIDMGIARFATFSDGRYIAPLHSFKRHEQRLRRYQRAMSRKVLFSNNWKKARRRVQKIHTRIGNVRRDFLHKTSSAISKNHAMVSMEDLQVKNLSRSARGAVRVPGKHVAAKSGLNKAILDQGWFEFRRQLTYKLDWMGGRLLIVPSRHTSQTCPSCGHVSRENRTTQANFVCAACSYANHADVVGAINILERGHRLLACGEEGSGQDLKIKTKPASMKQEPTEEIHALAA